MPLSEKTLAEMAAGAEAVAKHLGKSGIDPEYMESMVRTQQRAMFLQNLDREGKIRVERKTRPRTNDPMSGPQTTTVVHVGTNSFDDPSGEMIGAWPSEVLVAQVAMALAAGEGEKEQPFVDDVRKVTYYGGDPITYDARSHTFRCRTRSWTPEEYHAFRVANSWMDL